MNHVTRKLFSFIAVVAMMSALVLFSSTANCQAGEKEDALGMTVAKISKTTWGIQDLKRQGLKETDEEVATKMAALAKLKGQLKEMLASGVKPDEAIVAITGETLLHYCKRRKMTDDVVALLKEHGATK